MKILMQNFAGEIIDELIEGFEQGMDDVMKFFRENIVIMLLTGYGPEMA